MAIAWRKTFKNIDLVNSGNEFTINDYPSTDGFNTALNNTQYLYDYLMDLAPLNSASESYPYKIELKNLNGLFELTSTNLQDGWNLYIQAHDGMLEMKARNSDDTVNTIFEIYDDKTEIKHKESGITTTYNLLSLLNQITTNQNDIALAKTRLPISTSTSSGMKTDYVSISQKGLYAVTITYKHTDALGTRTATTTEMFSIWDYNGSFSTGLPLISYNGNTHQIIYVSDSSNNVGMVDCRLIFKYN